MLTRIGLSLLLAVALGAGPSAQTPAQETAPAPPPFEEWLAALRAEALAKGISQRTVDAALGSLERLPVVVERDRTQAERHPHARSVPASAA